GRLRPAGAERERRGPRRGPSGPPAGPRRDRLEDLRLLARPARLPGDDQRREPANAAHAIGPLSAARSPTTVSSLPAAAIASRPSRARTQGSREFVSRSERNRPAVLVTAPTPTRWPRRGPPTAAAIDGSAPALQLDQSPPVPKTAPIGSRYASVMTASASPVAAGNARSGPRGSPRTVVGGTQPES